MPNVANATSSGAGRSSEYRRRSRFPWFAGRKPGGDWSGGCRISQARNPDVLKVLLDQDIHLEGKVHVAGPPRTSHGPTDAKSLVDVAPLLQLQGKSRTVASDNPLRRLVYDAVQP